MAFCGHDPFCAEFNGERALAAAKENVDRHYAVVGVIEELNKTLQVMEGFMPDVFAGKHFISLCGCMSCAALSHNKIFQQ